MPLGKGRDRTKVAMEDWEAPGKLELLMEWRGGQGLTMREVAGNMGVTLRTLYNWSGESEKIRGALVIGRGMQIDALHESMFKRAIGFYADVEVPMKLTETIRKNGADGGIKTEERVEIVKHRQYFPPSETAGIFLLCNLDNEVYRRKDKDDILVNAMKAMQERLGKIDQKFEDMSTEDLREFVKLGQGRRNGDS